MRTTRQHKIDAAVLQALANVGEYLLPQSVLAADVGRLVVPRPLTSELEAALKYHDEQRRIIGIQGETETRWKLSDLGRAWLAENS